MHSTKHTGSTSIQYLHITALAYNVSLDFKSTTYEKEKQI